VFGMVRYSAGLVEVNVDAKLTTEMEIIVHPAKPLHATDFIM
jgi:hypothetical protein